MRNTVLIALLFLMNACVAEARPSQASAKFSSPIDKTITYSISDGWGRITVGWRLEPDGTIEFDRLKRTDNFSDYRIEHYKGKLPDEKLTEFQTAFAPFHNGKFRQKPCKTPMADVPVIYLNWGDASANYIRAADDCGRTWNRNYFGRLYAVGNIVTKNAIIDDEPFKISYYGKPPPPPPLPPFPPIIGEVTSWGKVTYHWELHPDGTYSAWDADFNTGAKQNIVSKDLGPDAWRTMMEIMAPLDRLGSLSCPNAPSDGPTTTYRWGQSRFGIYMGCYSVTNRSREAQKAYDIETAIYEMLPKPERLKQK